MRELRKRLPFRSLRKDEMLFHPFFEVEEHGILEGYLGVLVSSMIENEPFQVLTEYYGKHWTNPTEKRYMVYRRESNCSFPIIAEFPDRFWFYHFDEQKEEGPIYSIAFLPIEYAKKFDVIETKKFSVTRKEIRTMMDYLLGKPIIPVEHGIPYRGYIKEILTEWRRYKTLVFHKEWEANNEKLKVGTDLDLPNLQFCLQIGHKNEVFSLKNTRTRVVNNSEHFIDYLTAFDYKENKAAHVARKEDKISGREFIYGFLANEKTAILFEEDQPLAEVEIPEDGEWEEYINDLIATQFNRIGDIVFWRKDTMVPPFMEKITWEELKRNPKISIAEYSDKKIVCHHEHGCTKIYPLEEPYRFKYRKPVID